MCNMFCISVLYRRLHDAWYMSLQEVAFGHAKGYFLHHKGVVPVTFDTTSEPTNAARAELCCHKLYLQGGGRQSQLGAESAKPNEKAKLRQHEQRTSNAVRA